MSALLTSETGNSTKVVKYINECRDMGISVLPPDVNKSDKDFTPDGNAIRFGLSAIKNVGGSAVESITAAREKGRIAVHIVVAAIANSLQPAVLDHRRASKLTAND